MNLAFLPVLAFGLICALGQIDVAYGNAKASHDTTHYYRICNETKTGGVKADKKALDKACRPQCAKYRPPAFKANEIYYYGSHVKLSDRCHEEAGGYMPYCECITLAGRGMGIS